MYTYIGARKSALIYSASEVTTVWRYRNSIIIIIIIKLGVCMFVSEIVDHW